MIRQVDKSRYNIPMSGDPRLHHELMWYATDEDADPGVVILDLVDKDCSWVVLTENDQELGFTPNFSVCGVRWVTYPHRQRHRAEHQEFLTHPHRGEILHVDQGR